jgi:hypothetical protein
MRVPQILSTKYSFRSHYKVSYILENVCYSRNFTEFEVRLLGMRLNKNLRELCKCVNLFQFNFQLFSSTILVPVIFLPAASDIQKIGNTENADTKHFGIF